MPRGELRVFACRSGGYLGERVTRELNSLGCTDRGLEKYSFTTFDAKEVKQHEFRESVRGADTYVFQAGTKDKGLGLSPNDVFMEALMMVNGLWHANAEKITLVMPLLPYTRQDSIWGRGEPYTAKMIAKFIEDAKATRLVTLDLHSIQIKGFFDDIHVEAMFASHVFLPCFREIFGERLPDFVFGSTDAGGAKRPKYYRKMVEGSGIAMGDKTKDKIVGDTKIADVDILGDIHGRPFMAIDDMIDTGGTVLAEAETAHEKGATAFYVAAAHGLFNGSAEEKFARAHEGRLVNRVFVTDSVHHSPEFLERNKAWLEEISIARLLAKTIQALHSDEPISEIYGN